jgi:hypothetical protein
MILARRLAREGSLAVMVGVASVGLTTKYSKGTKR